MVTNGVSLSRYCIGSVMRWSSMVTASAGLLAWSVVVNCRDSVLIWVYEWLLDGKRSHVKFRTPTLC